MTTTATAVKKVEVYQLTAPYSFDAFYADANARLMFTQDVNGRWIGRIKSYNFFVTEQEMESFKAAKGYKLLPKIPNTTPRV